MVKILVIGSGAREHAIIKSLNKSKKEKEIYCLASNNNPGISDICNELKIVDINKDAGKIIKDPYGNEHLIPEKAEIKINTIRKRNIKIIEIK